MEFLGLDIIKISCLGGCLIIIIFIGFILKLQIKNRGEVDKLLSRSTKGLKDKKVSPDIKQLKKKTSEEEAEEAVADYLKELGIKVIEKDFPKK